MRNVFGLTIGKAARNPLAGRFLVEHEDLLPNESKVADIIGTALEELRAGAFGQSLMNALNAGNAVQAAANLDWGKFGQTLSTLRLPLEQQLAASGKGEAKALGDVVGHMAFNVTDPRAVEWAATKAGELVVTYSQAVRDDVRNVITSAFVNQTNPREIAGMIDRQVGLFPRWAQAVENRYQTSLTGFMGGGMSYSDAHERAQNLADAYRERLIDKRCQMIARTEVIRAANEGRAQAWAQAADAGLIDPATTTKEWVAEADACDDCAGLNTEQVWLDDSFSSGDDMPPAHPNCRCSAVLVPDGEPTEKPETVAPETETLPAMTSEDITPAPEEPSDSYTPATFTSDDPEQIVAKWGDQIGQLVDSLPSYSSSLPGDQSLYAIYEAQGYNGLPTVTSRDAFDQAVKDTPEASIVYRGIADTRDQYGSQMAEQYRSGDHYPGFGAYGNGTYTTTDRETALSYATSQQAAEMRGSTDRGLLEMMIHPDARVIDSEGLATLQNRLFETVDSATWDAWKNVWQDPGRAAAMMGYDAVSIPRGDEVFHVILNRTAVTVAAAP